MSPHNVRTLACRRAAAALLAVSLVGGAHARAQEAAEAPTVRDRIEAMTVEEKIELEKKRASFDRLAPEEKQRLRRLHEQVARDTRSSELTAVMRRYVEWLNTLTAQERAELADLSIKERIKKIEAIKSRQAEDRLRRLVGGLEQDDARKFFEWLHQLLKSRHEKLMSLIPPHAEEPVTKLPDQRQQRMAALRTLLFRQRESSRAREVLQITEAEINELISQLSPETRQAFDDMNELDRKKDVIVGWIRAAVFTRRPLRVSDEQLREFAKTLEPKTRERLNMLSHDDWRHEVRRYYYWRQFGRRGDRSTLGGPRGDGRFSHEKDE